MTSVHTLFAEIQENLDTIAENYAESNPPAEPASEEEIQALEAFIKAKLPEDYKDFLRICNGWNTLAESILFLSIEQIMSNEFGDLDEELETLVDFDYDRAYLLAVSLEDDTGWGLIIRGNQTVEIHQIHQSIPDTVCTFTEHLQSIKEMLLLE